MSEKEERNNQENKQGRSENLEQQKENQVQVADQEENPSADESYHESSEKSMSETDAPESNKESSNGEAESPSNPEETPSAETESSNESAKNDESDDRNEDAGSEVEGDSIATQEVEEEATKLEDENELDKAIKYTDRSSYDLEEFDWASYADSQDVYSKNEKDEYTQMYSETLSTIAENEVVEGTVISMNKREVVINIGYKSEGVVSLNEFRYNPDLKVGDTVEVYIESQEDKKGQLVLSHKKARTLRSWERVNKALESEEIIKGYIKCRTKGGMIVDVFGIEAFLPGSQIDVKPIRDYDAYVGKVMEFKVVKINHEYKNVVVSHKALIEAELEQQKKEIIANLEKGQVLEGTVKNITPYGVFIDLGGVDGLIHITDLSWGRVNHPEEIVQLDQKLNVVILDFDDDKKRIALGLKQLTAHPWDQLDPDLKVGDEVEGKVVVMADYGAFIEIAPGVEGLIHVSEMSWSQHLRSAQEFLQVGDTVKAKILTLDREERKMSLGIKQLKPDPWDNIEEKYGVGSRHTATVRNFTNFGVFVEIEEGVDGLIHISDLSWTKKIKHPAEFTAIGEPIEVVVLEIDKENRRLSLGHKQLEENPWEVFESIFTTDSIHEGTVIEVNEKGAIVSLPYGVEGFATPKHIVKEDGTQAKVDERLQFKVLEFSKNAKKIIVSHSRVYEDAKKAEGKAKRKEEDDNVKKTQAKIKSNMEKTTLGDISDLEKIKSDMEASAKKEKKQQAAGEKKATAADQKAEEAAAGDQKAKADAAADQKSKEDIQETKEASISDKVEDVKGSQEKKESATEKEAEGSKESEASVKDKDTSQVKESPKSKEEQEKERPAAQTEKEQASPDSQVVEDNVTEKAQAEQQQESSASQDEKNKETPKSPVEQEKDSAASQKGQEKETPKTKSEKGKQSSKSGDEQTGVSADTAQGDKGTEAAKTQKAEKQTADPEKNEPEVSPQSDSSAKEKTDISAEKEDKEDKEDSKNGTKTKNDKNVTSTNNQKNAEDEKRNQQDDTEKA